MKFHIVLLWLVWISAEGANVEPAKDPMESNDVEGSYGLTKNITSASHSRSKRAAGDPVSTSGDQYCILFNDISGTTGAQKFITDYVADLEELGWKGVVSSVKCFGLWVFYQDNNFDPTGHAKAFYLSRSTPSLFKLEGDYAHHNDKIVSLRYAGAIEDPFLVDSITLYEHHWYGGEEYFTLEDIPNMPPRMNDKTTSVIITGQADWTIYENKEFAGKSHCLRHGSGGKEFVENLSAHLMNDMVSSMKKGC